MPHRSDVDDEEEEEDGLEALADAAADDVDAGEAQYAAWQLQHADNDQVWDSRGEEEECVERFKGNLMQSQDGRKKFLDEWLAQRQASSRSSITHRAYKSAQQEYTVRVARHPAQPAMPHFAAEWAAPASALLQTFAPIPPHPAPASHHARSASAVFLLPIYAQAWRKSCTPPAELDDYACVCGCECVHGSMGHNNTHPSNTPAGWLYAV